VGGVVLEITSACPSLASQGKEPRHFSWFPLELIFLFDAEIIIPALFGLTVAGLNEVVCAVDEKPRPSDVPSSIFVVCVL
jgi:hypothetical protein